LREELFFTLSILAFWLAVYALSRILPLNRYGVEVKPLLLKYNSKGFKSLLYKFSSRWRRAWTFFSYVSILLGFGLMLFAITFLLGNLIEFLLPGGEGAAITPIIPGLTLSLYWLPYFLIAVIVAVLTHESAHGIVALMERIDVKSAGILVLGIFPGGFVEVDEDEIDALPRRSRMKIFSAGSSSNLIFGLLALLLISTIFASNPSGMIVVNVLEDGPLHRAGIGRWDVIYALNNTRICGYSDLANFMSRVKPGDRLIVSTSRGDFTIVSARNPEDENKAIIGILPPYLPYHQNLLGLDPFWGLQVHLTLTWLFVVSISVAIFNMLPIPMFDGDRFLQCLMDRVAERFRNPLKRFFNILSIFLIAANIILSLRIF